MNTQLEQRLRADMEQATRGMRVPPGLALKACRHSRRRTMTTRAATAAGAAAVLTAGTLTVAGMPGAFGHPAAGQQVPGGQQVQTAAYVVSRVEHALSAPALNNVIAAMRTVYPAGITLRPVPGGVNGSGGSGGSSRQGGGYALHWAYHGTAKFSAFTAGGQRLFDERMSPVNGAVTTTVVNYPAHTWWTAPGTAGPSASGPPASGPASPGHATAGQLRLPGGAGDGWPAFIRSQLARGAFTQVGKQTVDGVGTLKITGGSGHLTLWVNPATYLPVRLAVGSLIQTDFRWLPATPASLALLSVRVPAGFRQVAPPSP